MRPQIKLILLNLSIILTACTAAIPTAVVTDAMPGPTATAPVVQETTQAPAPAEPIRTVPLEAEDISGQAIRFWHPWDGERGRIIQSLIEKFNEENIYSITVTASNSNTIFEDVRRALAEGTAPNLVVGFNYHTMAWLEAADLPDLSPYITDSVWGLSEAEEDDFFAAFTNQTLHTGGRFGLPFYRTAEVLIYNKTWAEVLGFASPPLTPADLKEQACAANAEMRQNGSGEFTPEGGLTLSYESTQLVAWMAAFNGGSLSALEDKRFAFDRPENLAAFEFLKTLLDENCAWIPEDAYAHDAFANRKALFLSSTLAGIPVQQAVMELTASTDQWEAIPYPHIDGLSQTLTYGPDFVMLPGDPGAQLATWVLMKWLSEPENNAVWLDATGYFPVRSSTFDVAVTSELQSYAWIKGGNTLEPDPAWPYVKWIVSDTARVLFAPLITASDLQAILLELDSLAEEIAGLNR